MRIWNITPLSGIPSVLAFYGKSISPGRYADLEDDWVRQNPRPLDQALESRKAWRGESLPNGYHQEVQRKMAEVLNRTAKRKKLAFAEGEGTGVAVVEAMNAIGIDEETMPKTFAAWKKDPDLYIIPSEKKEPEKTEKVEKDIYIHNAPKEEEPPKEETVSEEDEGEEEEEVEEETSEPDKPKKTTRRKKKSK